MKLQTVTKILGISMLALVMTGCGGGSSSSDSGSITPPPSVSSCQVSVSSEEGTNIAIQTKTEENVIIGWGCTQATITDDNENIIGSNYSTSTPLLVAPGAHMVTYKYGRNSTDDKSIGVLYYLSSNIYLENLQLNNTIQIPGNTANIYKMSINQTSTYTVSLLDAAIVIYDSSLNVLYDYTSRNGSRDYTITLPAGDYYFLSSPFTSGRYCENQTGGHFSVTKI